MLDVNPCQGVRNLRCFLPIRLFRNQTSVAQGQATHEIQPELAKTAAHNPRKTRMPASMW